MKETKYRAWDNSEPGPCMISWELIGEGHLDPYTIFWNCPKHITLMQFTGIKDKDGVEIYEGDIVKNQYGEIETIRYNEVYSESDHGNLYTGAGFKVEGHMDRCEVIGNIYENPELL